VRADLEAGRDVLANLSRAILKEAMQQFPTCKVVNLTASPEVLAERLSGRGRETAEEIAKRLAQAGRTIPEGIPCITVHNHGPLDQTVAQVHHALQPVNATR
jgi:ribose 1,5-bisphosphokinase